MWVQPNTSVVRAIARGQWQAPLGSARPTTRSRAACRRARVRQGQAFGGAEEAPSLTAAARDGGGNLRSGRKNARGAGRTKEWSNKARQKWRDAPLTKKLPYKPYAGKPHVRFWCSEASCHSSGCKSRQQRSPVAVVVIPSNGEGDRSVGSLEVKALGGRAYRSDPYRRASNLTGRSKCVNQEAPKDGPRVKRIAGGSGVPSCSELGEGHVDIDVLDQTMIELPGVREDGMLGRNGQRKPGTTRGSPRRSRTAKALRISRHAVKSQCARGWGGWGRLSDDGARQHNLHPSEDPWGGGLPHLHGGARSNGRPDTAREYRNVTKCAKGGHKPTISQCMPGAGLSWLVSGRRRSKCQPSSRIGENPPYGMIGRVEETSASCEARSAPRLYPTAGGQQQRVHRCHPVDSRKRAGYPRVV